MQVSFGDVSRALSWQACAHLSQYHTPVVQQLDSLPPTFCRVCSAPFKLYIRRVHRPVLGLCIVCAKLLELHCNRFTMCASCLCRCSHVSLSAKVPLSTTFTSQEGCQQQPGYLQHCPPQQEEDRLAVAGSETGSAPAYAAVPNNLPLVPT